MVWIPCSRFKEHLIYYTVTILGYFINLLILLTVAFIMLVNSCIYYAHQTREIYQALPYLVDFKAPVEFWNPPSMTVLVEVVHFE